MTLRKQAYLAPFNFTGSQIQIRLSHPSGESTLTKNLDPTQTFWLAGDAQSGSNRTDLLAFVSGAINTNTVGLTASVTLDPDTQQVQMSGNLAFGIQWAHTASTIGLNEALGFPASKYPTVNATTFTAPSQSSHSWMPDWPTAFDTYDEPIIIGHKSFSLSMAQSGYNFDTGVKERQIQFEYLPSGSILEDFRTEGVSSSLEAFHNISLVKDFRLYDDRSDRSQYGVYCFQDLAKPWLRSGDTRQIRYNANLNLYGLRKETGDFVESSLPAEILTFTATPSTSSVTASVLLEWTTSNATSVDIDQSVGTGLGANSSIYITGSASGSLTYSMTAYGDGGNDTAQVSVLWQSGGVAENIFDKYTWDLVYLPKDINETAWTWEPSVYPGSNKESFRLEHKGTSGNRPLTSQSSSPLNASALGSNVANYGVRMNTVTGSSTTTGMASVSSSQTWTFATEGTSVLHYRLAIYQHATTNGRRVLNWQETTTKYHRIVESTSDRWSCNIRDDADGTTYSATATVNSFTGGAFYLVDWIVRPQSTTMYANGGTPFDVTNTEVIAAIPSGSPFGIGGAHNGTISSETTFYWVGVRSLGTSGSFSLAQHQADAISGGFIS